MITVLTLFVHLKCLSVRLTSQLLGQKRVLRVATSSWKEYGIVNAFSAQPIRVRFAAIDKSHIPSVQFFVVAVAIRSKLSLLNDFYFNGVMVMPYPIDLLGRFVGAYMLIDGDIPFLIRLLLIRRSLLVF